MKKESFIIIMPVYNEAECIEKVIQSWMKVVNKYPGSEILAINDGSKDETKNKLNKLKNKFRKLKVLHKNNEGNGPTVMEGYWMAIKTSHNWVFQTDSDDQYPPEYFHKLWKVRHKSNFILGYRLHMKEPLIRIIISKMISIFNIAVFGISLKDANTSFRLMKREYLKKLLKVLPKNLVAPNIFLSLLASLDSHNVVHIPVPHRERKTGKISILGWNLFRLCVRGFRELVSLRLKLKRIMKILDKTDI
mgnify:FL=1